MAASMRSTASRANPRVTLLSLETVASSSVSQIEQPLRGAPVNGDSTTSPGASSFKPTSTYTSLRRTTRSTARNAIKSEADGASYIPQDTSSRVPHLPTPSPTPPRKRLKREPTSPLREIKQEAKDSPKKAMPLLALAKPHPEPPRWRQQYRLIERMRKGIQAPVDTMGCERPRTGPDTDPKTLRFHILISLMLSSQTKDAVTSQAVTNLHNGIPGGLTAATLAEASPDLIAECINKVGFWRRKTEYIQAAAKTLLEQPADMRGDVPKTLEGLCALKGVGPKMAFLALQCAWDINAGIGVDVHVHRITNRLGWHKPKTTTPEQTRINLESWLPSELRKPINPTLVGFGQVICLPVGPRCDICLLGQDKICPSRAGVKAEGRKEVIYTFTREDTTVGGILAKEQPEAEPVVKIELEQ